MCIRDRSLDKAAKAGKNILFEAQLGALRDSDFGIYPYTSSSNVIGAYAPVGAGIPNHKIDRNIGIMKAYSSCAVSYTHLDVYKRQGFLQFVAVAATKFFYGKLK